MKEYTPENITQLKDDEVFVFGSNARGFHGAGSAGMALRGEAKNTWRDDNWFQEALKSPVNSPKRVGNWAVLGMAHGFQEGRNGKSYAIETIKQPGLKRSTSLLEIKSQIEELAIFAKENSQYKFLVTKIGCALAGYSVDEIAAIFKQVKDTLPDNIILPKEFEFRD